MTLKNKLREILNNHLSACEPDEMCIMESSFDDLVSELYIMLNDDIVDVLINDLENVDLISNERLELLAKHIEYLFDDNDN